eukprot:887151-Rhodomonas_salina.1
MSMHQHSGQTESEEEEHVINLDLQFGTDEQGQQLEEKDSEVLPGKSSQQDLALKRMLGNESV